MSRVVTTAYAEALKHPGEKPPLALLPDDEPGNDEQIAALEATNRAILALTSAVASLCKNVVAAIPKTADPNLLVGIEQIVIEQRAILGFMEKQFPAKPLPLRFKVVRDKFGELDYVDVTHSPVE